LSTSCKKKGSPVEEPPVIVVVGGKELPANTPDGVSFINSGTSALVNLYAPEKKTVEIIGEFNNWTPEAKHALNKTPDGKRWWVQIDGLDPNKEYAYQFLIDGTLKVADPYTEKILDPNNDPFISSSIYPDLKPYPTGKTTGIVSVMQANKPTYTWKNTGFTRPEKKNLVIYELLVRDFLATHDYKTLKDTLNYLTRLGVNAIELMPVNEFEGNLSWGYNPSFYFAPDKYYGTKNALKAFIDECHSRGIAVILDMVLNHSFGQSPMAEMYFDKAAGKPTTNSPWFNATPTHPYNVGYDMNHESAASKYFSKKVMEFWMKEYKIDGYRFDLSKGFTQKNSGTTDAAVGPWGAYDASRVAIWNEYNNFIKSVDANNFYVILEHFGSNQEEKELSENGMMFWNNLNYNYNEASMGWLSNSNFSGIFYPTHTFTQTDKLIGFMESHDEERTMFKNIQYGNFTSTYSAKNLATALKRNELCAAFFFTVPGPKMIWQFEELGYDVNIDFNGRTGDKPIRWEYYQNPARKNLYNSFSKFIKMKLNNPVFTTTNFEYDLGGAVKTIRLNSPTVQVMVVGNFDVSNANAAVTFPSSGTWFDYTTGQTITLASANYSANLVPGEYHIYSNVILK
jgi:glycosidase